MLKFFAKYKFFAVVMLLMSAVIVTIIYNLYKPTPKLPVYQPDMVTADLVDTSVQHIRKFHKVGDFALVNQLGDSISQAKFKDKIYVADFFFTTCQSICIDMAKSMQTLQKEYLNDPEIMLLSHSVTPEIDDVKQLQKYAKEKGVNPEKWQLVTGDKKQIYQLARKQYLASKTEGDGGPYDLVHTENFVLVDKEKRIRGFYDGTNPEEIEDLIEDISILKLEYQPED
ncbi:SCO family protein [Psychroflexus sp. ALD_RP9]|uniref:SCO family protein n=1 Tax=Psychroflexus sp. ALD_RP9 TaxID=2777186 RepID=UPI001A8FB80A|nr:SCO family protein [Psychroflexus sp. ALD_RP9]QSS96108.1 SCO family protein [Psychroflexus sp. ALD_RP9]